MQIKALRTVAHIAQAGAQQLGYAVRPSSTTCENMASDLLARNLQLDADKMAHHASLERNGHEVRPAGLAPIWGEAPVHNHGSPDCLS